jgi:hypothetical protein
MAIDRHDADLERPAVDVVPPGWPGGAPCKSLVTARLCCEVALRVSGQGGGGDLAREGHNPGDLG